MRRMTRRELGFGSIGLGLAACSGDRRPKDRSTVTVLYRVMSEAVFDDPAYMPGKFLVFMPLAAWNSSGELEGRLAEAWEHSADFRTWTIRLREGIRWHDGVPVTAHDMKFTLDLLQHPDTLQFATGGYAVNVLDNRTYTITYHRQDPGDDGAVNDWTVCWPKHLLEGLEPRQINSWDLWAHPVWCGPYRHVRTVPKTLMAFEANQDYFRGKPKIERRDAAVRRALTFAINRRELLQVLNLPVDAHPMDFVRTDGQAARGDFAEPNPYNPELAGRLLDQAGWVRGRRGLRERDAQPLRFKALVASSLPESLPCAVYVQDQFKRLGVRMDITVVSVYSQILERYKGAEFEAMIAGRGAGNLEKDLRGIGYANPVFFELLEKAKAVFDPKEKEQLHAELTGVFKGDLPLTFLHPFANTTIASTRIRGLDGSPYRGDLTQCMDELWLEDVA